MAKDRRKLQHIHSSIPDKQPTPQTLEVGEIAVNNAKDQEFLSIKNSEDKVVRFSSDANLITWVEKKEVIPYSGTVDNVHLDTNRSNIEIKLNQVAASNTVKHDVVNGATDIDGQAVNPSEDGGLTNGAGFAIDMSQYAMIGANPSFSSLTVTDKTDLSGNTTIANGDGTGTRTGHTLTIKTTDVTATNANWTENITNYYKARIGSEFKEVTGNKKLDVTGTTTENHGGNVTIINSSNVDETTNGSVTETIVANKSENIGGNVFVNITGTTNETKAGNVTENNSSNYTVNTTGVTSMNSTGNTCIASQADADLYGKNNTKVGIACDGSVTAKVVAQGNNVTIDANTDNISLSAKKNIVESAEVNVSIHANSDICETAGVNGSFYAASRTNLGLNCDSTASSTTTNIYGGTINEKAATGNTTITISNTELGTETKHVSGASTTTVDGNVIENHSGTTTYNNKGDVTITNLAKTTETKVGDVLENNSGNTTVNTNGNVVVNTTGTTTETKVGNVTENHSGTTTENNADNVTVNNQSNYTVNTTGVNALNSTSDTCITSQADADVYGKNNTKLGVACNGAVTTNATVQSSGVTNVYGPTTNITGTTLNETFTNENVNVTNYDLNGTNICISGATKANFYGKETNVGIDCNGTTTATTINVSGTTINEGGTTNNNNFSTINTTATTVNENITTYNVTANTENHTTTGYNVSTTTACLVASNKATLGGDSATNIGTNCEGAGISDVTTVYGYTINNSANTINTTAVTENNNATTINTTATTINTTATTVNQSGNSVNVTADTNYTVTTSAVCLTASDKVNIGGDKTTNIGTNCAGSPISDNINLYSSSSVTINSPKTIITGDTYISGNTYIGGQTVITGTVEIEVNCTGLTSHTVSESFCETLGRSNVTITASTDPEAGVLKRYDFYQNGNKFGTVDIPKDYLVKSGSVIVSGGTKYIDLVLNTRPTVTGTPDEHIYINVADLVTDTVYKSNGGTLSVTTGHNTSDGTDWVNYDVANSVTWSLGTPSADSTGYNGSATKNIVIPSDASHIANRSVSWSYGSVTGATDSSYVPSQSSNGSFVIPKSLKDLNNNLSDLTFTTGTTSVTGSPYNGSAAKTITIPSDASHIANRSVSWSYGSVTGATDSSYAPSQASNGSFVIPKSLKDLNNNLSDLTFTTGTTSVAGSPYNGSAAKTITIPSDASHIGIRSLTIKKNNESVGTYSPASTSNTEINITVPTSTDDITNNLKNLSFTTGTTSVTGSPYNGSAAKTITIPSCVSHLDRRTLSWSNGAANTGSYDPGSACSGSDNISIPSSLSHLTDWSSSCLNVANNICVTGTITATGGMYTSSDRDLKENIDYMSGRGISKASKVKFREFNYKDDASKRKVYGVIAQEIEDLGLNELVHYDENGIRSVDYTGLLILKIAELEKKIGDLYHQLEKKNN